MLLNMSAAMVDGTYQSIAEALKPGVRESQIVALANHDLYSKGSDCVEGINAISGCADVALPRGRAAGPRHSLPEGKCRCRRSEHRRRPACAPAPSNACAPVSARASRPSKSPAIKAVRLAPFDFL